MASTPAQRDLTTPVQFLKGVGPAKAALLANLGLQQASDLLTFFPRDYQDLTEVRLIGDLEADQQQSFRGTVDEVDMRSGTPGKCIVGVLFKDDSGGFARGVWFNQPFQAQRFRQGQEVLVTGKPKRKGLTWEVVHPQVQFLEAGSETPSGRLLPVYPLTSGIKQHVMRAIVRGAVNDLADQLPESFPEEFLTEHRLLPVAEAVRQIHFPDDPEKLELARRRFVYQDLLLMQLALGLRRRQVTEATAPRLEATAKIDARIKRLLPFELTPGQQAAIREIAADLNRTRPMNRLLQGEVGSGKTVVAIYALLVAIAHGCQVALMAPTEILARQHAETIKALLADSQVRRATLLGGLAAGSRTKLLEQLAAGEIDLVIGTHALLQEDVRFAKLGLAIIDEQHKFGVRQRAMLRQGDQSPHYLIMTATPIPRTVTMTMFGDLDVTNLRDVPPGRQPVHTYLAAPEERDKWWEFVGRKLREGRQGFVVAPLVDASGNVDAAGAEGVFESLANGPLEAFRLGLVHGRMPTAQRDAVMDDFRNGKLQVLVATSVVEVGVDVPNATLMTIEDGDRFGLAALHQLRGRIRRGKFPGFCCVFADEPSDEARERLDAFVGTDDGFELAEIDFRLRGPGELLGTRQHGAAPFFAAQLPRDESVLEETLRDARALIETDPELRDPGFARLRKLLARRYDDVLELGDVG